MAQHVIGLDVGAWSIKAALIESTLRGFALVDFAEHHLPRDPAGRLVDENVSGAVRACLREFKDWDTVCTAFPGKKVMIRELELPFSDDKRIKSILGFQLEDQLPIDIDDLIYDYVRLSDGEGEEGTQLMCAAVEHDQLESRLDELQEADADPRIVTLDTLAYRHLLQNLGEMPDGQAVALVDVGHTTTSIAIAHEGRIRAVRTISRGGHQITTALMRGLEIEYAEAEQLKHTGVRLDGQLLPGVDAQAHAQRLAMVGRPVEAILREVRLSLHNFTSQWGAPVERVLLFGGTVRLPGFEHVFQRKLGVEVQRPMVGLQQWCQLPMDENIEASLPNAVALGLRHIEEGSGETLNFRQGDLAFESDFKALRERAGIFAVLLAVLLAAFVAKHYVTYETLTEDHGKLVTELERFSEDVLGEKKDDFEFVLTRLGQTANEDQERVFPEITAFKVFYDVTSAQQNVNEMQPTPSGADARGGVDGGRAGPAEPGGRAGADVRGAPPARPGARGGPDPLEMVDPLRDLDRLGAPPAREEPRLGPRRAPGPRERVPPRGRGEPRGRGADDGGSKADEAKEAEEEEEEEDDGRFKVEMKTVQIDLKVAHIKGEANNIEAVEALSAELKKHKCFLEVETTETVRISFGDRQDWLRFGFRIDISCSEKAKLKAEAEDKKKKAAAKANAKSRAEAADDDDDDEEDD